MIALFLALLIACAGGHAPQAAGHHDASNRGMVHNTDSAGIGPQNWKK